MDMGTTQTEVLRSCRRRPCTELTVFSVLSLSETRGEEPTWEPKMQGRSMA